ncbi:MAG: response regulator, partial [Phaeodactylibacter sp.]|nr:response regulator [Phaeodactylibacter sp.]
DGLKSKLRLIRRNGEVLLRLISQILDLAKLESNTLKINYVQGDILPYLRYISESLHSVANARNVMLRLESNEASIVMDYDPERLLQIVHNLLSNAVKFTPSGGKVALRADMANDRGGPYLRLSVADTGAGIPPEDLPYIFDRFRQANNLEKAGTGGTGIGLALTKELVNAMNGDISVESELGKGAAFTVRLPVTNKAESLKSSELSQALAETPARPRQAPASTLNPQPSSVNLLIIEDNPDVVEYLTDCLKDNYALDFAYNGRAGIEKALENIPDLIVSDVMMPEKDGFEVVETLKHDERTSHIPIVMLTARADVESRIKGLRRGADAYLAKPFHREELLATLNNLLEWRKKLQAKFSAMVLSPSSLTSGPEDAFLQKLHTAVQERIGDAGLKAEDICRAVGMGRSNLYAKLSALTGMSFNIYLRSLRLHKAKELLQTSDLNVSEVAYKVGFNDPKYFSRVFSEEFGLPPSELKR